MAILKSLETNYLRDTIVEVRYEAPYDYSILKGMLYAIFFEEADLLSSVHPVNFQVKGLNDLKVDSVQNLEFHKDGIKFSFASDRINFNMLDGYPGWKNYFPVIEWVLSRLSESKILNVVSQIGIRYISDHANKTLEEVTKITVGVSALTDTLIKTSFRLDFLNENDTIGIILSTVPVKKSDEVIIQQAVIDIDTIHRFSENAGNLDTILSTIDRLHTKEKEVFVSLLKEDYLPSLNPKFV